MLLTTSDTKRTLMYLFLFTHSAQRELVLICNCYQLSLDYNLAQIHRKSANRGFVFRILILLNKNWIQLQDQKIMFKMIVHLISTYIVTMRFTKIHLF